MIGDLKDNLLKLKRGYSMYFATRGNTILKTTRISAMQHTLQVVSEIKTNCKEFFLEENTEWIVVSSTGHTLEFGMHKL